MAAERPLFQSHASLTPEWNPARAHVLIVGVLVCLPTSDSSAVPLQCSGPATGIVMCTLTASSLFTAFFPRPLSAGLFAQQWKHSDVYTNMDSAQENRTDAALAKVLRAAGVPPGNIQMLEDTQATLATMRAAYAV